MSGEQQAPAGWYDDSRGAKRYWDGQIWTEWVYDPAFGGNGVRSQPLPSAPTPQVTVTDDAAAPPRAAASRRPPRRASRRRASRRSGRRR